MDYLLSLVETEHDTKIVGYERKFLTEAFSQIDKRQYMNLPDHVAKRKIVNMMGSILEKVRELDIRKLQFKMLVSGGDKNDNAYAEVIRVINEAELLKQWLTVDSDALEKSIDYLDLPW